MEHKISSKKSCHICNDQTEDNVNPDRLTNRSQKMKAILNIRLNRVEGQVRGIRGMLEKDVYCDEVLNQIFAVQSAMKSIGILLLENHLKNCIVKHVQSGEMEIIDELLLTIKKLTK